MKGWVNRMMLGAILGTLNLYIYASESYTQKGIHLDASVIAFLAGLSVKLVYGVLEKIIDTLYNKFDLGGQVKTQK
jgi:hypothetical protein